MRGAALAAVVGMAAVLVFDRGAGGTADGAGAALADAPSLTFGNGCEGERAQTWGGYRRLRNGSLRLVWLDSGSRRPCGVALEDGAFTPFTNAPSVITLDAHLWCRDIPLDHPTGRALVDGRTGKSHAESEVDLPRIYDDLESAWEERLNSRRSCGRPRTDGEAKTRTPAAESPDRHRRPDLENDWRCNYVERGAAGPADNELRIVADRFVELSLVRRGQRIQLLEFGSRPLACQGPKATVNNVDRITQRWRGGEQAYGVGVDLSGGQLAPGATPEADGTSEIEIKASGSPAMSDFITGGEGEEFVELGTLPDGQIGVNLNAADELGSPDVDLTLPPDGIFGAELFAGNDRFDASGGSVLPGSPAEVELFVRSMGADADEIVGGAQGGAMVGGEGRDHIVGGRGPDRIGGGPGDDAMLVRGGGKDSVECGEGNDSYEADARDDLDHCEVPGQRPRG